MEVSHQRQNVAKNTLKTRVQTATEYLAVLETMGTVLWACTGYLLGFANEKGSPAAISQLAVAAVQVLVRHALHASPAAHVELFCIGFLTKTCLVATEHGVDFVAGVAQAMEQDQGAWRLHPPC